MPAEEGLSLLATLRLKELLGLDDSCTSVHLSWDDQDEILLDIECTNEEAVDRWMNDPLQRQLAQRAWAFAAQCVNFRIGGKFIGGFPPELVLRINDSIMNSTTLLLPGSRDEIFNVRDRSTLEDLVRVNPNLKIVRFDIEGDRLAPGVGILTGANCENSSGLSQNQWVGRNMNVTAPGGVKTWIDEEWKRFCQDLLQYTWLPNYEWRAHLYTGELVQMVGNVQLINFGGLSRCVEILSCTKL